MWRRDKTLITFKGVLANIICLLICDYNSKRVVFVEQGKYY